MNWELSFHGFNFFSLDYLYYPISFIMWFWHKVFGSFMGAANPWAWVLSIVFLVFTLRARGRLNPSTRMALPKVRPA